MIVVGVRSASLNEDGTLAVVEVLFFSGYGEAKVETLELKSELAIDIDVWTVSKVLAVGAN